MENISNIVNVVLEARGWRGKVLERMAVELWAEVVGEPISHNTLAESFQKGTLHVRARSPQWSHELHFHEARIIARLNGRLKQPIVQKIRYRVTAPPGIKRVAHLKKDWEDPTFPEVPPLSRKATENINDEASRRAEVIAAKIEDEEVRAVMVRLIASALRSKEQQQGDAEE